MQILTGLNVLLFIYLHFTQRHHIASSDWMIVNNEFRTVWREMLVA